MSRSRAQITEPPFPDILGHVQGEIATILGRDGLEQR